MPRAIALIVRRTPIRPAADHRRAGPEVAERVRRGDQIRRPRGCVGRVPPLASLPVARPCATGDCRRPAWPAGRPTRLAASEPGEGGSWGDWSPPRSKEGGLRGNHGFPHVAYTSRNAKTEARTEPAPAPKKDEEVSSPRGMGRFLAVCSWSRSRSSQRPVGTRWRCARGAAVVVVHGDRVRGRRDPDTSSHPDLPLQAPRARRAAADQRRDPQAAVDREYKAGDDVIDVPGHAMTRPHRPGVGLGQVLAGAANSYAVNDKVIGVSAPSTRGCAAIIIPVLNQAPEGRDPDDLAGQHVPLPDGQPAGWL